MKTTHIVKTLPLVALLALTSCAHKISASEFANEAKKVSVSSAYKTAKADLIFDSLDSSGKIVKKSLKQNYSYTSSSPHWKVSGNTVFPTEHLYTINFDISFYNNFVSTVKNGLSNTWFEYFASSSELEIRIEGELSSNKLKTHADFHVVWNYDGLVTRVYEKDVVTVTNSSNSTSKYDLMMRLNITYYK